MNHIWQKYFLKELSKVLLLFLSSFYLLYVLIDYSAHAKTFHQEGLPLFTVLYYYLLQFTKRADILLPVALLISSIKVLSSSSLRGELVALATGGIPLKRVLFPFLLVATLCALFCYTNEQVIIPHSFSWIDRFENTFFKSKKGEEYEVKQLLLEDNTLLVYQAYEEIQHRFFDLFWIKSADEFYKIKFLYPYSCPPMGEYVEHLVREESGALKKRASLETLSFPEMHFTGKSIESSILPPQNQSLRELATKLSVTKQLFKLGKMTNREARVAIAFYHKLFMPFACFLAVLCPAPFLLRFRRHVPVFWIYALSIMGLIAFFTLMSSARILGESQVLPPLLAMMAPPFLYLGWSLYKLRSL